MQTAVLPVLLMLLCVVGLAGVLLVVANVVSPGGTQRVKQMPYESGMDPVHDTRRRFTIRFHLVAIAFLVFDVEILFLYPWAVAMHSDRPVAVSTSSAASVAGSPARASPPIGIDAAVASGAVESRGLVFAAAMFFLALLALGFVYDWRKGVFRWR
jgi:NADH-quinone oxidoreductase subunit A